MKRQADHFGLSTAGFAKLLGDGRSFRRIENYFIKLKYKVLVKGLCECEARTVGQNSVQVGIHNRQLVLDVINQPALTRR